MIYYTGTEFHVSNYNGLRIVISVSQKYSYGRHGDTIYGKEIKTAKKGRHLVALHTTDVIKFIR
jgi:hypothetical protein